VKFFHGMSLKNTVKKSLPADLGARFMPDSGCCVISMV
jgi:hypothetical protein